MAFISTASYVLLYNFLQEAYSLEGRHNKCQLCMSLKILEI